MIIFPKGGGFTDDLRMSEADINDSRHEALAGRIDKVKSYLEKIVQHITVNDNRYATDTLPKTRRVETTTETQVRPRPTPSASCAELHIQTEVANDDTVSIMVDEDISDYEEHDVNYVMKDCTQHIFYPEPNLKREFTPMKRCKNLSIDTSPLLSPAMEETLFRRIVAFQLRRILWFRR